LLGDYLAIVTLFFGQAFVVFVNAANPTVRGKGLTGGPNGIADIDANDLFGYELVSRRQQYWFILAVVLLVLIGLHFLSESRTGRAWRALREDPLAAEAMGMPVNWLKLTAFAFGAAVAALTGTLVTALNGSVFPQTFEFPLLITVYTMVILGGAGSQAGVVIGAIGISVLLEVLREPGDSRFLFYALVVLGLVGTLRASRRLALVLGGTVALGFVLHALAGAIDGNWTAGAANGGGRLGDWANEWVVVPGDLASWVTPVSYIGLVAAVLALTLLHGRVRLALLVPTLYLAAFVWENVMLARPEPTRFVVLGAILIAVMIARPEGVLGEKRVEIV
jgi:ABC-type branched-subunit amino acid transport system permease subunit